MRLVSNFIDYYDHHFGNRGPEFRRLGTEGLSKPDQFLLLETAGYDVPPHGILGDLMYEHRHGWYVVYDDVNAHCGDGKRLIARDRCQWDGCLSRLGFVHDVQAKFASAHIGFPTLPSVTWRMLQVGRHRLWVEYRSTTDWRSNCGEGSCEVVGVELDAGYHPSFPWPLFAIDFAIGKEMFAIDLNTAPGIRGSGVERILPPKKLYEAIYDATKNGLIQPHLGQTV